MKTPDIDEFMNAFEKASKWNRIYEAVLKNTGDKQQALDAVEHLAKIDEELEAEAVETWN